MREVPITPKSTDGFGEVLPRRDCQELDAAITNLKSTVRGRVLWHVNSTPSGGGVAEMLASLLPYLAGAGIDVRWLVVDGDADFFEVTKRLHNRLHDQPGDGGALDARERAIYDATLATERDKITRVMQAGDIAVLHDPQTAGIIPALMRMGVRVVWRCHIGVDEAGEYARSAWDFLRDDVASADVRVFSRESYVWSGLTDVTIISPCIDVLSEKNRSLDPGEQDRILHASGVIPNGTDTNGTRPAWKLEEEPVPADARVVVQVSRWDRLKDPVGVLRGFASLPELTDNAHLVLAGPDVEGVADDPESVEEFAAVRHAWEQLDTRSRSHVHLVQLPMTDIDENARIVNALQRRADVVVQKSLVEGFGLTVAEAMWKQRPVVASRVGGIQDQVVDGTSGILLDDPRDEGVFAQAVSALLENTDLAARIGEAAHRRVCDNFLPLHHFRAEAELFARLDA